LRQRQRGTRAHHHQSPRQNHLCSGAARAWVVQANSCFSLRFFIVSSGLTAIPSHHR
jgi:hypothetical protein